MGNKQTDVVCPHCNETRTIQQRNQYDTSKRKPCRPCSLKETKKFFGQYTNKKQ